MGKLFLFLLMIPTIAFSGASQHFNDSFTKLNLISQKSSFSHLVSSEYLSNALDISKMTSPASAYKVYMGTKPDPDSMTRGGAIKLYKEKSKSVVIIATNDAIGTGSLISDEGDIITNWHVIQGFKTVSVIFKPEKKGQKISKKDIYNAKVVKIDEISDLALLKLTSKPQSIRALSFGDSLEVEVAQDVHAIGHPSGKDWTYTRGFISQIRNDYEWDTGDDFIHKADVIQTQTPISPGNSGGPLLNNKGELIGVNTFKSKGESLNFAISSHEVVSFLMRNKSRIAKKDKSCKEPKLIKEGYKDGIKFLIIDTTCDGKGNAIYKVPDDESKPITFSFDTTKDGSVDLIIYDEDRDGKWEYSLSDTTGDGKANMIGRHKNGELLPYKFEPIKKDS